MRKKILYCLTTILILLSSTVEAWSQYAPRDVYGWLRYDDYEDLSAFCKFTTDDAENIETVYPFDPSLVACAGAYADGDYYVYLYETDGYTATPHSFNRLDITTGKLTQVDDYRGMSTLYQDMTYDYSTQTMYAIGYDESTYNPLLITVDLQTGEPTVAYQLYHNTGAKLVALACSYEGQLYSIDEDGDFWNIDKTSGRLNYLGSTAIHAGEYLQSMEFDHETSSLYWAAGDSKWYSIDTNDGYATEIGYLGMFAQVVGLYIPFTMTNNEAPAAVSELKAIPGAAGALSATLSWKNPSLNHGGNTLTSLTKIEIYRNETLVHTIDNPDIGGTETWEDTQIDSSGTVTYRVAAINTEGENSLSTDPVFVGRDIPAAPTDATATIVTPSSVKLTWTTPTTGANGGWIDAASLTYTITRLPDEVVLHESVTGNEYTDNTIEQLGVYSYRIQAVTADGKGGHIATEPIVNGEALQPPYGCDFSTEDEFRLWSVVDANKDEYTWDFFSGSAYYTYNDDEVTPADDWLISSPIHLKQGQLYRLSFKVMNEAGYNEKVSVHLGTDNFVETQSRLLGDYDVNGDGASYIAHSVVLPADLPEGKYHISFRCHSEANNYQLYLTDILLEEAHEGSIAGTVTDGSKPIEGVEVSLKDTEVKTMTDENGKYTLAELKTGSYTLCFSKIGYRPAELTDVAVDYNETTQADMSLEAIPAYSISGKVLNMQNTPVEKAKITLDGYDRQYTETAADGTFNFSQVYQADDYRLFVERYGLCSDTLALDVTEADIALETITLADKALTPYHIKASIENEQASLSWEKPLDTRSFRHDNGLHGGRIGSPYATPQSVYGSVFRTPATLTGMTWFTEKYLQEHPTVNIFVFDLDSEGNPTSQVLYSQMNVSNTDDEWSSIEFPEPINAPRGYMLALSYDGHVGLGLDTENADEAHPFTERTHCYSDDYTTGKFSYLEEHDIRRSCMIRATGILYGEDQLPSATTGEKYSIWRLKEEHVSTPEQWELLTAEPIDGYNYTDKGWSSLTQGYYQYAIQTIYNSGVQSENSFSQVLPKDMDTQIILHVTTNTPENEAEGATATLTNQTAPIEFVYTSTVDAEGKASFEQVRKGIYKLSIKKQGFIDYDGEEEDFSTDNRYEQSGYTLNEYVVNPFNLEIAQTAQAHERQFNWNVSDFLFDDFEAHADFAINSPGDIGWTYIDVDGAETTGMDGVEYTNARLPMAYMVFNPYETEPNIGMVDKNMSPYSGEKFLASLSSMEIRNNDFFISPKLNFNDSFTFKFYAKSYTIEYGFEELNVGYSTTGNETGDFTWLNGEKPLEIPAGAWKEYRYTIPAEANYVAINCVSFNRFIVMIDDVFIGKEAPEGIDTDNMRQDISFEVYLDGQKVAETQEKTYLFKDLKQGLHKAGVKAVFSSTTTSLVEMEFDVEEGSGMNEILPANRVLYPNPAKDHIVIPGTYDYLSIQDLSGKEVVRHTYQPQINVLDLPNGVYIVKIISNGQSELVKLIINR